MKVMVLGSNSFAGSQYIAHGLARAEQILGVNRSAEGSDLFLPYKSSPLRSRYQFQQLDINQNFAEICQLMEQFQPDYVVDFAGQGMVAESWQNPEQWYQTNIVAKVKLHQFLVGKSWLKKYIRVSTPEVYGSCDSLIVESNQFNPSTPYAVSHAAIDMSLNAFFKQYQFPVVFTRFSNFYGAGQQLYRIIPRTMIYALLGKKLPLHGGGHAVRAFIHGQDVARAIEACIDRGEPGQTYHFSTDRFVTIRELVTMIYETMGLNFGDQVELSEDRPGKDLKYLMNDQKAQQTLGWSAEVELEQGIQTTLEWVKEHIHTIQTLPLEYQHKV